MRLLPALTLTLLASLSWGKDDPADKIYFGINSNYSMPLVEIQNPLHKPEVERGLLKDLGEAIAAEMKLKTTWILLPKNRVAPSLLSGDIDIICHIHEIWQPAIRNDVLWTSELYPSVNVIVSASKKTIQKLKDLHGERVGTVVNFIYHDLESEF
ncbi:MAG: transporter substrate-binding domain-containing protein [Bdellovibrionales bacterium]|nr:transporter substrate-binding domain-containing protein [Bdellovibrionales bacterium]